MFLIWGSRGITTTKATISFNCPTCKENCIGKIKQIRNFFTFFFIPLIPLSVVGRYLECSQCQSLYNTTLLNESEYDNLNNDTLTYFYSIVKPVFKALFAVVLLLGAYTFIKNPEKYNKNNNQDAYEEECLKDSFANLYIVNKSNSKHTVSIRKNLYRTNTKLDHEDVSSIPLKSSGPVTVEINGISKKIFVENTDLDYIVCINNQNDLVYHELPRT